MIRRIIGTVLMAIAFSMILGIPPARAAQPSGLAWTNPTDADLVGIYVYQATSSSGPFAKIATLGKVTTFTFSPVLTPGQQYYWYVTAFDTSGNESVPSNTASNDVTAPAAPGACHTVP